MHMHDDHVPRMFFGGNSKKEKHKKIAKTLPQVCHKETNEDSKE